MTAALEMDTGAAVELLAAQGYRCLAPFTPRDEYDSCGIDGAPLGAFVDVETTGLGDDAKVIELAIALFDFSSDGRVLAIGDRRSWFNDPGEPIPPDVTALTHITDDDVRGQCIPVGTLELMLADVSLIVAHNAEFDRVRCERIIQRFAVKHWACSQRDVDWSRHGYRCAKLGHLLMDACGEHSTGAHRALEDVLIGIHVLATAQLDSRPAFAHLLDAVRRPTVRFRLIDTPRGSNGLLKQRGYRAEYEGTHFVCWWKDVPRDSGMDEHTWIVANGMGRPSVRLVRRVDAFTSRSGRQEFAR